MLHDLDIKMKKQSVQLKIRHITQLYKSRDLLKTHRGRSTPNVPKLVAPRVSRIPHFWTHSIIFSVISTSSKGIRLKTLFLEQNLKICNFAKKTCFSV